ncbi:long chain base biosynthesis protein 2a-like [Pyrus ussuriensis x Pyrus communis]|uniref:Long chain base biosynthesis protein 2a-like n=1 Tax=Pyrus ussuriensis x Pyrus communis TaxID=2448454 RepID=A0A5N5IQB4_9ROSA|nr:long chain base biosynthesis protein 2a-like [Pyrus ussuriensis x Pyrus communis]
MARCGIWWEGMMLTERRREREGGRGIERGLFNEKAKINPFNLLIGGGTHKHQENVVETIIPKSLSFMNAFQLIAMSNDLDLPVYVSACSVVRFIPAWVFKLRQVNFKNSCLTSCYNYYFFTIILVLMIKFGFAHLGIFQFRTLETMCFNYILHEITMIDNNENSSYEKPCS